MEYTPAQINRYTFFKLPSVWWCGIRVKEINAQICRAAVQLRWFNQNPFQSIFWAVQGMAAELTTGMLLVREIEKCNKKVSFLVVNNKANFSKKARGRIVFQCNQGKIAAEAIASLSPENKTRTLWLSSTGVDEQGDQVSHFEFEWTLLLKNTDSTALN